MTQTASISSLEQMKERIKVRWGDEPRWSLERRLLAAEQIFEKDWPRLERTPLKKRKLDEIPVWTGDGRLTAPARPTVRKDEPYAAWLTFADHDVKVWEVGAALQDNGVIAAPLASVLTHPLVQTHLGHLIADDSDKISALTAALWEGGMFLYVPDGFAEPVSLFIEHQATHLARGVFIRNLVWAGRGARVVVSERLTTEEGGEKALLTENTEIFVQEDAEVEYGAIQLCSLPAHSFLRRYGRVGARGKLLWNVGEFGAQLAVAEQVTHLSEPGASSNSITVFFGSRQQHQDYTAKSLHHAPHTQSNMVARGVMKDKARSIFTGVTHIESGAKGSDGRQREQTLMLSDEARADAIPSLIIDERDVYAAHAASAGPVDKSWVFYLMSRGLSESEAVRLIVHGFLAPVIDSIPRPLLRDAVWDAVERKIRE
ncbi:MAG: SufD family Fe-S cluster assembly protein [Firmicutes bacterium]|nr:SufD family Fe-S cluster assembly protein [Bacillota bacterium]